MALTYLRKSKHSLFNITLLVFLIILLMKVFFAVNLDLYSDEVFYWQASSYPALAYSDLPFMTAVLAGIGSSLDPGNPFAVRILFILLGSSVPILIYWLALPITGKRLAIESASMSLCLPLLGSLGLLAVPDVPLIFWGILSIGFFERALRTNQIKFWLATSVVVALGFCTHYRFILYPVSAIVFLLVFRPARKQLMNPKLWTTITISSLGLIPVLWFNVTYNLDSAMFYFVERHPWQFQPSGLLHIFKQAGVVSPPLYLMFLATIYFMYNKAKLNELPAALLLSFCLTNLLVYSLLAPWADTTSTSIHWPLSGYVPLLVFFPESLRWVYKKIKNSLSEKYANLIVSLVPIIGLSGTFLALLGVGSQAFQTPIQKLVGNEILSTKMAGWKEFSSHTQSILDNEFPENHPIIITDNYYTAAQIEFSGLSKDVYTLDKDKAVRDGRIRQYQIWHKHEDDLNQYSYNSALYITENNTLTVIDKHNVLNTICRHSSDLNLISELNLFGGDKSYSYYTATHLINSNDPGTKKAFPCPFPPRAWIDSPQPSQEISGSFSINGWAYNEDVGIDRVQVLLNQVVISEVNYGLPRHDVVSAMHVLSDPNIPNLGFTIEIDTTKFENDLYEFELKLVNNFGTSIRYGKRMVSINNL